MEDVSLGNHHALSHSHGDSASFSDANAHVHEDVSQAFDVVGASQSYNANAHSNEPMRTSESGETSDTTQDEDTEDMSAGSTPDRVHNSRSPQLVNAANAEAASDESDSEFQPPRSSYSARVAGGKHPRLSQSESVDMTSEAKRGRIGDVDRIEDHEGDAPEVEPEDDSINLIDQMLRDEQLALELSKRFEEEEQFERERLEYEKRQIEEDEELARRLEQELREDQPSVSRPAVMNDRDAELARRLDAQFRSQEEPSSNTPQQRTQSYLTNFATRQTPEHTSPNRRDRPQVDDSSRLASFADVARRLGNQPSQDGNGQFPSGAVERPSSDMADTYGNMILGDNREERDVDDMAIAENRAPEPDHTAAEQLREFRNTQEIPSDNSSIIDVDDWPENADVLDLTNENAARIYPSSTYKNHVRPSASNAPVDPLFSDLLFVGSSIGDASSSRMTQAQRLRGERAAELQLQGISTISSGINERNAAARARAAVMDLDRSSLDDDDDDDDDIIAFPGQMGLYGQMFPGDEDMPYMRPTMMTEGERDEELKSLLENIRPDMDLETSANEDGRVLGMSNVRLMKHQRTGLAWLEQMEDGSNKGGILADDMGLGKTIQSLALILSRKQNPSDSPRLPTLIVTPVSLIKQWEREINTKTNLSVYCHHGPMKKMSAYKWLHQFDIVITSYGTLASEFREVMKWEEMREKESARKRTMPPKPYTMLVDRQVYRIILDEAQYIKNMRTKSALACCRVEATFRWCLTGTPMQNSIDELFSLIKFLRIRPYNEWSHFSHRIALPIKKREDRVTTSHAMKKLQILLRAVLLRRTKYSLVDGVRILNDLPEKTVEMVHTIFSEDEEQFYRSLENKAIIRVNKYLKAGSLGRNYSNVLVLLLRLRQACDHPYLLSDIEVALAETEIPEDEERKLAGSFTEDVVKRICDVETFECPMCLEPTETPKLIVPCGHHSCAECLVSYVMVEEANTINQGRDGADAVRCPTCRGEMSLKKLVSLDAFNKVHRPESDATASEDSDDECDTESEDSDGSIGSMADFIVDDTAEGFNSEKERRSKKNKGKAPAKNRRRRKADKKSGTEDEQDTEDNDSEDLLQLSKVKGSKIAIVRDPNEEDEEQYRSQQSQPNNTKPTSKEDKVELAKKKKVAKSRRDKKKKEAEGTRQKEWITSAKIEKIIEILQKTKETRESAEGRSFKPTKTIIFSFFTSFLDLLEEGLRRRNYDPLRYQGSMSTAHREEALKDFRDPSKMVDVFLVSLRAGNVGLNLTEANQVVIVEPFWNPYVEEQAIDRTHRIGQTKHVYVHRLVVKNTVEDRILALQEKKRQLIDASLSEDGHKAVSRLSLNELVSLFRRND